MEQTAASREHRDSVPALLADPFARRCWLPRDGGRARAAARGDLRHNGATSPAMGTGLPHRDEDPCRILPLDRPLDAADLESGFAGTSLANRYECPPRIFSR